MNHLCNSHCEFCGADIKQEFYDWDAYENRGPYTFFSLLLVATNFDIPLVLDYGFQCDFSCSVCSTCAHRLLASDENSYAWEKCHVCGLDTRKEDFSAFRLVEVVPNGIEQHTYKRDPYEFISADIYSDKGPTGHTVCMSCVLPELRAFTGSAHDSGEEMMPVIIENAINEGDVAEDYLDYLG